MSVLVLNKLKILSLLYTVIVCSFFFFWRGGGVIQSWCHFEIYIILRAVLMLFCF